MFVRAVAGVHVYGSRAERTHRGGDLLADKAGLADAGDDDLAFGVRHDLGGADEAPRLDDVNERLHRDQSVHERLFHFSGHSFHTEAVYPIMIDK